MDTQEESGEPVTVKTGNTSEVTTPPIIITPPPLSAEQVDKIIKAAEAAKEMVEGLGSLYVDYCRWVLSNYPPMLIPPLVPPAIVPETTP